MPWQMQISLRTEDGKSHWHSTWRSARVVGLPYEYDTKEEAQHMLETDYPNLCRADRLDGKNTRTRVIEVEAKDGDV
jgi:hypothetical protein